MNPVNIAGAEHYGWGDGCDGWHLLKRDDVSIIQERMPPGTKEVRHMHEKAQQFFFVLEGEATVEVSGGTVVLRRHEGVHVLPRTPHQFRNEGTSDVVFLVISVPQSHGDRVNAP